MNGDSIIGRLTRSLALVSSIGALLLLLFIGVEYRISFSNLSNAAALHQVLHELAEHVLLPMVLLAIPMALAGRWAITQSVKPLRLAAERLAAAKGNERGVRIDAAALPLETAPFVAAINTQLERVDQAAAMHEAFAADIAHELRTPLTLLSLELDRLDCPGAAEVRGDVAAMCRLVDQLMLLAQIDADRAAQIPPTQTDLHDVASDVVAQMAPAAVANGKTLELRGEVHSLIWARREALGAALRNLVENGLRVTPPGVPVTIWLNRPGEIAVRDGGPGLSAEELEVLSRRLRRADNASHDGAGLGLAIVSRIVAAHGGQLLTNPAKRELRLVFPVA